MGGISVLNMFYCCSGGKTKLINLFRDNIETFEEGGDSLGNLLSGLLSAYSMEWI